jgi:uncharacterized protein YcaQ
LVRHSFSKEKVKQFILERLHLFPKKRGKGKNDILFIVRDIGGLQDGWHFYEMLARMKTFQREWLLDLIKEGKLIYGHVLRKALRIVPADEYALFFKATRSIMRKKAAYYRCPEKLTNLHKKALAFIEKHQPIAPSEFSKLFSDIYPEHKKEARRLFYELYNFGEIIRVGLREGRPRYGLTEAFLPEMNIKQVSEEDAREWLASKCLKIYGPFCAHDIAHWVGWTVRETRNVLKSLHDKGEVTNIEVEGRTHQQWLLSEDLEYLDGIDPSYIEQDFVRILFNDDALLLGYYRRLEETFGFGWKYSMLSKGEYLRPAILFNKEIIGELTLKLYSGSSKLVAEKLVIRKKFANENVLEMVIKELERIADFAEKELDLRFS